MDDDDAPPELVDVSTLPAAFKAAPPQEAAPSRVPITIVTGKDIYRGLPCIRGFVKPAS